MGRCWKDVQEYHVRDTLWLTQGAWAAEAGPVVGMQKEAVAKGICGMNFYSLDIGDLP